MLGLVHPQYALPIARHARQLAHAQPVTTAIGCCKTPAKQQHAQLTARYARRQPHALPAMTAIG